MSTRLGLRDRKKAQTRDRLADVAAALFAEHGYDEVSIQDVARHADVSDQTVYNYFPAKHDLVLDRAEEIRQRYGRVLAERPSRTSPAEALRRLVDADIQRFFDDDPVLARGQFPALCLGSPVLRRFALESREQQTNTIADAITQTSPTIPAIVAKAHAAALISVIQTITDSVGASVLSGAAPAAAANDMQHAADVAFDELERQFHAIAGEPQLPTPH